MSMTKILNLTLILLALTSCHQETDVSQFKPFVPPVSYEISAKSADSILQKMSIEEKLEYISGYNSFFIKGFDKYGIPSLYLSDATQGVHIRKELDQRLDKSTAFPCPLCLSATWNVELAHEYAKGIGEECRAGGIAVLLGPGMNIYRISQCGRNFEYFGEDPYLTSRMVENYVVGVQSTGTIATLKHFVANNTDFDRYNSNSILDERTLNEIYLPAFKAGIDAGAMAVMCSYNLVDGEWAGQSEYVIKNLLRGHLGFKGLVMTDWWSVHDALKIIKSGQNLEMPGNDQIALNAKGLLKEGKVTDSDINSMAKSILTTTISMGLLQRPVKDTSFLKTFAEHERIALQTAREGIVLLRNQNKILPVKKEYVKKILFTGMFAEKRARGGGSGDVEGYNPVSMLNALRNEFGEKIEYIKTPTPEQLKKADIVILSIGTFDEEGYDRPFDLPDSVENMVVTTSALNSKTIVVVNSGSGVNMSSWNEKVAAILYAWYPGQNGNLALAEIISGKTNPSAKLPISIEKRFEDSPGYGYMPKGETFRGRIYVDSSSHFPVYPVEYKEGVFVGYRWYESKKIEPLYPFGFGLSYTRYEYADIKLSNSKLKSAGYVDVEFTVKNSGKADGAEIAQLYVQPHTPLVARPVKELKGFKKIWLKTGESKTVRIRLQEKDFAYWDDRTHNWLAEAGEYTILVGAASNDIRHRIKITLK